jgi:hypothetical protein
MSIFKYDDIYSLCSLQIKCLPPLTPHLFPHLQGTLFLLEALRRSNLTSSTKFFNAGSRWGAEFVVVVTVTFACQPIHFIFVLQHCVRQISRLMGRPDS